MPGPAVLVEGAAKALLYASLLLAIGASAVHWLLLPRLLRVRTAGELNPDCIAKLDRATARLGLIAVCFAAGSTVLRVWTHTVSAFGFEGARSWDSLALVAFRSRWGQNWKIQVIAAAVCIAAGAATARSRRFWPFATFTTAVFAATMPLLGHAAGNGTRMAVHVAHILAAGVWLGSLAVVVLITVHTAPPIRRQILRRFSVVALPGAATVVAAGLILSWLYVGSAAGLWLSVYGRILMLKAGLVGCIAVCGYINWQRLRKPGEGSVASLVLAEVALAAAVAIVSGYLTEVPHP